MKAVENIQIEAEKQKVMENIEKYIKDIWDVLKYLICK